MVGASRSSWSSNWKSEWSDNPTQLSLHVDESIKIYLGQNAEVNRVQFHSNVEKKICLLGVRWTGFFVIVAGCQRDQSKRVRQDGSEIVVLTLTVVAGGRLRGWRGDVGCGRREYRGGWKLLYEPQRSGEVVLHFLQCSCPPVTTREVSIRETLKERMDALVDDAPARLLRRVVLALLRHAPRLASFAHSAGSCCTRAFQPSTGPTRYGGEVAARAGVR